MICTIIGWVVFILLAAWFIVSVAAQFSDRIAIHFPRLSSLGLIPCWTFFAPRPGVDDIHLLYRDRLSYAEIGELTYVPTIEDRRWYHFIWNPKKYHSKIFCDLTSSLRSHLHVLREKDHDPRIIMLSTPYIMILHLVMRLPRTPEVTARQFILASTKSLRTDPQRAIVFFSEFHCFEEVQTTECL